MNRAPGEHIDLLANSSRVSRGSANGTGPNALSKASARCCGPSGPAVRQRHEMADGSRQDAQRVVSTSDRLAHSQLPAHKAPRIQMQTIRSVLRTSLVTHSSRL